MQFQRSYHIIEGEKTKMPASTRYLIGKKTVPSRRLTNRTREAKKSRFTVVLANSTVVARAAAAQRSESTVVATAAAAQGSESLIFRPPEI